MKQATARQKPDYENSKTEKWASHRRSNHANIEAMQNLIISAIAEQTEIEMPPKCRHLLSAIQGAHGGGKVVNDEFERDYLTLAAQLQFTGTVDARRARVRDWIDGLEEWQSQTYLLITIIKGGKVLGYRDDGSVISSKTTFIDHLLPVADEAVQRARDTVQWRGDKERKIKSHPGIALAAQVGWAIKELSRHPDYKEPDAPAEAPKPATILPLSQYVESRERIMLAENTRILNRIKDDETTDVDEIDARLAALEVYYARTRKAVEHGYESARAALLSLRDSRCKRMMDFTDPEELAREVDEQMAAAQQETSRSTVNVHTCDFSAPEGCEEIGFEDATGVGKNTPPPTEKPAGTPDSEPNMLEWALEWARQGYAVIPNHTVMDNICSCRQGSECRTPGKHPRIMEWEKAATTDEAQIARWWKKWPSSNIGAAMGAASGIFALDVDPKSGGNASLSDLIMAHGDEWLKTRYIETGSLGFHFYFTYPADIDLRNSASKIAPGIDIRGEGGQVILPPSLHFSGRRYNLKDAALVQPAPAWLVEVLTRAPDQELSVVVDFQERKKRSLGGGIIPDGERNDTLFKVGCAIWGSGSATDLTDLHSQLLQVNSERCSPPLADAEVAQIVGSIQRYPKGIPISKEARA